LNDKAVDYTSVATKQKELEKILKEKLFIFGHHKLEGHLRSFFRSSFSGFQFLVSDIEI